MYRTYIFYRACGCFLYAPSIFRTTKDGSGFIQERDLCYAQISSLSSCTRMYNCLTVYFKRLTETMLLLKILNVSERTGCPWFHAAAMFLRCKNSRPEVYTEVHFWTVYFQKAYGKGILLCCYSVKKAASYSPLVIVLIGKLS